MWAKQSTAATLIVGPILDSTGAEYTSAVIGDLSISKNGGTLTALAAAATLTHIANGQYTLVMTTGNLDTLGRLQITCNKSTYQMPEVRLMVVPAMVFDSMILGSDRFDVNVTHVTDTAQTAGDLYASQVAIAGYIDTEVGAIKAKTDQLTFTTANKVDSTAELDSASRLAIWNTLTTETFTADSLGDLLIISDGTNGRAVKVTGAHHIAADVHECQADGLTASTEVTNIQNASGYLLAVLAGACADPQTASETYAITVFGSTFTVDMAGQTSTGTRTAPTLTKT